MAKAAKMVRALAVAAAVLCGTVAAASMLLGCGEKPQTQCYNIVSISRELGAMLVFNECSGEMEVRPLQTLPSKPAPESDDGGPGASPQRWAY